jgi:hypothetical protein
MPEAAVGVLVRAAGCLRDTVEADEVTKNDSHTGSDYAARRNSSQAAGPSELDPTAIVTGEEFDGAGAFVAGWPLPPGPLAVPPAGEADRVEPLLHAETTNRPAPASKTMEAAWWTLVDRRHWETIMMFSLGWA